MDLGVIINYFHSTTKVTHTYKHKHTHANTVSQSLRADIDQINTQQPLIGYATHGRHSQNKQTTSTTLELCKLSLRYSPLL